MEEITFRRQGGTLLSMETDNGTLYNITDIKSVISAECTEITLTFRVPSKTAIINEAGNPYVDAALR